MGTGEEVRGETASCRFAGADYAGVTRYGGALGRGHLALTTRLDAGLGRAGADVYHDERRARRALNRGGSAS